MEKLLNKVSGLALMTALTAAIPSQAVAQQENAAAAADENVIVVTARGREENIQEVPLAITAFDEEAIERQGIQELDDVARFTPGFSFEDFSGGFAAPVIRGQAQTRVTALESNVSTFFDGVYIPRSWAVDIGTANLQRIEVVKGPQSARYGRNAFAGAINYLPRKASIDGEVSGEIEATVGIDERRDFGAFLNFSVNDYFALAGSYNYSKYDGSWDNAHPFANLDIDGPSTRGKVGGWDNTALSVSAAVRPFDGVTLEASYNYFDTNSEARASRFIADSAGGLLDPATITPTNNGLVPVTNCGATRFFSFSPLICGELPGPADSVVTDPRSFASQAQTGIFRLALDAELTDDLDLSYTFANVNGDVNIGTSGEPDPINCGTLVGPAGGFAPLCNFQQTPVGNIDYDTHEARLTYDNGTIRVAIGGFYSDGEDNNRFSSINIAPITNGANFVPFNGTPVPNFSFNPGPFNILLTDETIETEVISVFGEAQWTSGDGRLRLGIEGRYSETEITATNNRVGISATNPLSETFKEFTPRFTAEYDLNDEVLFFASAARGVKAGGFNPGAGVPDERVFGPESNWTYELGAKSSLFDGILTLNGSIFYTDWTDIQVNAADEDPANPANPNVPSITLNLGNAKVFGVELAARLQATDNLSFDATFSHSDAEYSTGTVDSRFSRGTPGVSAPCDNIVCNTNGDISGNEVERTPPTQASFAAQWDGPLGDDGSYFLRTDVSWQSDFFADSANLGIIPSRFLVNGSVGVNIENIDVKLWVRNAFDKRYLSNAFVVLLPFGNTYGEFFGERRSFGITTGVKF
ncbi:MAG: TonB-dependent receptor [Parasphingorhabdus sp.]|uniref:TonB-dependent receptor n=1 Tax=Parasphingorhabdus sp. TaxID=2709688 RepID=UPI003298C53A